MTLGKGIRRFLYDKLNKSSKSDNGKMRNSRKSRKSKEVFFIVVPPEIIPFDKEVIIFYKNKNKE